MDDQALGHSGGDLRHLPPGQYLDLSTCVNRYGPPGAVMQKLQSLRECEIRLHPYEAAEKLTTAYGKHLGVSADELLAGRGTTEFIWSLSRTIDHECALIPLPAYSDFLRAFPGRGRSGSPESKSEPSLESIAECMKEAAWVIVSNPNNPTGIFFERGSLVQLLEAHRSCTLVVDESYLDFLPESEQESLIGSDSENLLVLRSPSKFYGIAGVRTGIAWTKNEKLKEMLASRQDTWPISALDALVAVEALGSQVWADEVRLRLRDDALWLEEMLESLLGNVIRPVPVHYRFLFSSSAREIAADLLSDDVVVRVFSQAHGIHPAGLRITAPTASDRDKFQRALSRVMPKR